MSNPNLKYCPICSKELKTGKISLPLKYGLSSTQYVHWYSDEKVEYNKRTAVNKDVLNVPAGYCEKCDKIFAEFDIREKYNPIGEEEILPTYDMDYYEESADPLYEDKIVSYDKENYDEKYNTIGGYKIITE